MPDVMNNWRDPNTENAVKLIIWKDEETWETSDLSRCIRGSGISGKTQAKLKAHVNQMFEKIILRAEFQPVHLGEILSWK